MLSMPVELVDREKVTSVRISWLALAVGVIGVSFSSIIIKSSMSEPAAIAAYRLALTVILLLPAALVFEKLHRLSLSANDVRKSILSGVFLAFHFLSWITSLRYTGVASSVVLVSCHTLIIVMWAKLTTGKTFSRRAMAGVLIALLGTAVIGAKGWSAGEGELFGDALAFLGAIFMAGYCIVGQDVRQRVGVLSYTTIVYGTAALVLFGACAVLSVPVWPYPPREWRIFWLLAIIPTVFGHTVFNWALKYVPAWAVSAAILGEPVGAATLAFFVLGESPGTIVILGGIMVITGLYTFLLNDAATTAQ